MAHVTGGLVICLAATASAAAQPAIDWHALCVDEIRRDIWKTTPPPPDSIEHKGETVRVIAVPAGVRRLSKGKSKCAARIIDAFRLLGANSVTFYTKELDAYEYNKEQCNRELRKPRGFADTDLVNYISLLLKCVPNRKNAAIIREWLHVDNTQANGYQNLDFRLFEMAFLKSERCKDQKDFAAYYECFANAISEADLSKLQADGLVQADVLVGAAASSLDAATSQKARPTETPSAGGAVQPQGDENAPSIEGRATTTAPPALPPSAATMPAEPTPTVPTSPPTPSAQSASLLMDYLALLAIISCCLVLFALTWKFAVRRSLDAGCGRGKEPAPDKACEASLWQDAGGLDGQPAEVSPTMPIGRSAAISKAVRELHDKLMTMQFQRSELQSEIPGRDCGPGVVDDKVKSLLGQLSALEAVFRGQQDALLNELSELRRQLSKEQDDRAELQRQFAVREADLNRRCDEIIRERDELNLKCGGLTHERDDLKKQSVELAAVLDGLRKERESLACRLAYTNSQSERLKSGLPNFISPADVGNPLSEFWVTSAKADQQAHGRLEGVLRSYKIVSDDSSESSGRLFELVNDIGVQLYALMDALGFDESRKREVAADWQVALNANGNRRFMVSVPWPGTPIDPLEMVRKDQRYPTERIKFVRSWVVKDMDGRIARRAIVE